MTVSRGRWGPVVVTAVLLIGLALLPSTAARAGCHLAWISARVGPGVETHDISDLAPGFRICVNGLLDEMKDQGWEVYIRAAWRDEERQAHYMDRGWTKTMNSKHRDTREGRPVASAVDLATPGWPWPTKGHAEFYTALMEAAPEHGLVTGGTWAKTDPMWARYGLGWDSGHVKAAGSRRCR